MENSKLESNSQDQHLIIMIPQDNAQLSRVSQLNPNLPSSQKKKATTNLLIPSPHLKMPRKKVVPFPTHLSLSLS
jgi:hypothetical protein